MIDNIFLFCYVVLAADKFRRIVKFTSSSITKKSGGNVDYVKYST